VVIVLRKDILPLTLKDPVPARIALRRRRPGFAPPDFRAQA
jgi:hypothetical protein